MYSYHKIKQMHHKLFDNKQMVYSAAWGWTVLPLCSHRFCISVNNNVNISGASTTIISINDVDILSMGTDNRRQIAHNLDWFWSLSVACDDENYGVIAWSEALICYTIYTYSINDSNIDCVYVGSIKLFHNLNRKCQDYIYVKGEYQSTM